MSMKKALIATIIAFSAIIIATAFFPMRKNKKEPSQSSSTVEVKKTADSEKEASLQTEKIPVVDPQIIPSQSETPIVEQKNENTTITGKLVGFKDGSMIVDQPTGAVLVGFGMHTKLSFADGKVATIGDLKAGSMLTVERNGSAGQALSIQIRK